MSEEQKMIADFFKSADKKMTVNANGKKWQKVQKKMKVVKNKSFGCLINDSWLGVDELKLFYKKENNKHIPLFYVQVLPGIYAYVKPCKSTLKAMTEKQISNYYDRLFDREQKERYNEK